MHQPAELIPPGNPNSGRDRVVLAVICLLIAALYASLAGLKGIDTDEGFRLGIINGGREFTPAAPGTSATWGDVLRANRPYAYQPLYFLIQNSVMRAGGTHDEFVLKLVNVFFLWLSLQGLLALSRDWALAPRLFVLGLFSLNAYLFMHVLQLREYIAGIAFYVWSTWLVLKLDRRPLGRSWADTGWFATYGAVLTLGFFTQSWVVFPALAQGLFLVVRRAGDRLRFYAHLAVSYVIVLAFAYPYLQTHQQKVNIGHWGSDNTQLWPRLVDGLHLVLSGQSFGYLPASDFIFWFWLLLLGTGAVLLARRPAPAMGETLVREYRRQASLMLLCLGVTVAFQIGYFLKVDTLSVWPRYFALHYFFVIWLVGLGFKCLHDRATARAVSAPVRRGWQAAVTVALIGLVAGGVFQVWSYRRDPYSDTGLSSDSNWRSRSAGLARLIQPGDVVLTQDFLHSWTLTFTRPLANPVLPLPKLVAGNLPDTERFVYLDTVSNQEAREDVTARLARLGFSVVHEAALPATEPGTTILNWRVLIFERP